MSFDARSRERLEALGRTLPAKLPLPTPAEAAPPPRAVDRRHRVETEQDPGRLFHELMDASRDGTVPSHLMDRLKGLEQEARPARATTPIPGTGPVKGQRSGRGGRTTDPDARLRDELYTAFTQLLLEDEES
ncbi:hypothetical protein NZK32_13505 [Cyanobium sp. FGCU-52]|nr:hypothetical protein [Cyanobium sp. FGCU52]